MEKKYIAPQMQVVEIEIENSILAGSGSGASTLNLTGGVDDYYDEKGQY